MFKKTVNYIDYNDQEQTRTLYFNITKSEVIELETEVEGGFTKMLKDLIESKDGNKIMKIFKTIILKSYGIKTPDGQGFDKSEELTRQFEHSAAYDALFTELCTNTGAAVEFITKVMPLNDDQRKDVIEKAKESKLLPGE